MSNKSILTEAQEEFLQVQSLSWAQEILGQEQFDEFTTAPTSNVIQSIRHDYEAGYKQAVVDFNLNK